MQCPRCKDEVSAHAVVCPNCAQRLGGAYEDSSAKYMRDTFKPWFLLFAFLVPIYGFFAYLTMRDTRPKSARTILLIAIVSSVIYGLVFLIRTVLGVMDSDVLQTLWG